LNGQGYKKEEIEYDFTKNVRGKAIVLGGNGAVG